MKFAQLIKDWQDLAESLDRQAALRCRYDDSPESIAAADVIAARATAFRDAIYDLVLHLKKNGVAISGRLK